MSYRPLKALYTTSHIRPFTHTFRHAVISDMELEELEDSRTDIMKGYKEAGDVGCKLLHWLVGLQVNLKTVERTERTLLWVSGNH